MFDFYATENKAFLTDLGNPKEGLLPCSPTPPLGYYNFKRKYQTLKKLFGAVLAHTPPWDALEREIDRTLRVPKGCSYEGCHFGVRSKSRASFDAHSRFFRDDATLRPLEVDDDIVTRWHQRAPDIRWKREYFVCLNVGLRLKRDGKVAVAIRSRKNDDRRMHQAISTL